MDIVESVSKQLEQIIRGKYVDIESLTRHSHNIYDWAITLPCAIEGLSICELLMSIEAG